MKKYYIAEETASNKYVKHTGWKLERKDVLNMALSLLVIGYVTVRFLIG